MSHFDNKKLFNRNDFNKLLEKHKHPNRNCNKKEDSTKTCESSSSSSSDTLCEEICRNVEFKPAFTFFVAKSWPVCADPNVFFTTITGALNRAALITPFAAGLRSVILIAPGDYSNEGNIVLVSNVNLVSLGGARTVFVSSFSWTPSNGINASQLNLIEEVTLDGFSFTGPSDILVDFSFKNNTNLALFDLENSFALGINVTGNTLNPNTEVIFNNDDFLSNVNITNLGAAVIFLLNFIQGNLNLGLLSTGDALLKDGQIFGDINVSNGNFTVQGTLVENFNATGNNNSILTGASIRNNISANAGTKIDARASQYGQLVGPGSIDRNIDTTLNGLVLTGLATSQIVNIPVPYLTNDYNVIFTPTNILAVDRNPFVTLKTVSNFTVTSSATTPAGATFDVTLVHH